MTVIQRPGPSVISYAPGLTYMRPRGGALTYLARLLAMQPSGLVAVWPLVEASGEFLDHSGNGLHSDLARNWTYAQTGVDGLNCAYTPSATCTSSRTWAAWNSVGVPLGNEGTMLIWLKRETSWAAKGKFAWTLGGSGLGIQLWQDYWNADRIGFTRTAGGIAKANTKTSWTSLDWHCYVATWSYSGDTQQLYIDGAAIGAAATGLGQNASAGWHDNCAIGSSNSITCQATRSWPGWMQYAALWKAALSAGDVAAISTI